MILNKLVQRADQLIETGRRVLENTSYDEVNKTEWIESEKGKGFRAASLSFIERLYGPKHPYYTEFSSTSIYRAISVKEGIAILEEIKNEISGGWLFSVRSLITAEIFADFIEMADYLLSGGYKDPAAVLAGSVLEEHLRQLCLKSNIEIRFESQGKMKPKKADKLNSELAAAEVYEKLDQKNVTAWLDLRNKAAHGNYNEYTIEQVKIMVLGIMEFAARIKC